MNKFLRLIYKIKTFKDYGKRLNRDADVENALWRASTKDGLPPDECRKLALKMGVPDEYRL